MGAGLLAVPTPLRSNGRAMPRTLTAHLALGGGLVARDASSLEGPWRVCARVRAPACAAAAAVSVRVRAAKGTHACESHFASGIETDRSKAGGGGRVSKAPDK